MPPSTRSQTTFPPLAETPYDLQSFLAAIVESSNDAVITKSLDGTVTSWNPAAERMYGYTAAEAVGRPITFLAPPERRDEIPRILRRLARGERVEHFETDRVRKDGRILRVSLSISPIRDGEGRIIGASAIARDVTERRRADRILDGQLRLLELVARDAPLSEILERTVETLEAQSRDGCLASILLLDDRGERLRASAAPSLPEAYNQAIDGIEIGPRVGSCGTAAHRREAVIVEDIATDPLWADFRDLALEHGLRACWSTPILATGGGVLGTFAMYYRQPRRPGRRQRTVLSIFNRIAAIAIERDRARRRLIRQAHELEVANQRKNDFLAVLAHELRTPLGAIANAVELARVSEKPADEREARGIVERQSRLIARLVDDLLDVSRIGRGLVELETTRLDLRQVAQRAVESVAPQVEGRGQRLRVDLPATPVTVDGDEVRLGQVVTNLLVNASKYSADGGLIELAVRGAGPWADVSVRDDGLGIEPERLDEIFELFAQGDDAVERPAPGLGIGLTLVRQLVELHGGSVDACSEGRGKGSQFRVRLPAAEAAAEAAEDAPAEGGDTSPAPAAVRRLRVLLVDDHEETVTALETLLELWGHEARAVFDGPSALAAARELEPELVLLDIGLPEMDGWEIARRLRRDPATAGAKLVALTGFGQETDRARSREAGFDHHLTKPTRPQELEERLRRWFPAE